MIVADSRWHASLDLGFCRREPRTVLHRKQHRGPLQVQKVLYPEGPGVCHVAVLHPPGGVASGDSLACTVQLEEASHVCLTTPGATKWYRCPEHWSRQTLQFTVGNGATLEWLPRENILFDASRVQMLLDVELAETGTFLGWEIMCFGRRASGERWHAGSLKLGSQIRRQGRLLWSERAHVAAGSAFIASPVGLAGFSVSATLVLAGPRTDGEPLAECRSLPTGDPAARTGITSLPSVLLARYLGHSSEDAFNWFTSLWSLLRPAHLNLTATPPRLWAC